MSTTLKVLVLHPHSDLATGKWLSPGDVVFWSHDELSKRETAAPFTYYKVLSGFRPAADTGQRLIPAETLPIAGDTARAATAALDAVSAVSGRSAALLRENYMPKAETGFVGDDITSPAGAIVEPLPLMASVASIPAGMEAPVSYKVVEHEDQPFGSVAEMRGDLPTNAPAVPAPLESVSAEPELDLPTNEPAAPAPLEDPAPKPKRGRKAAE